MTTPTAERGSSISESAGVTQIVGAPAAAADLARFVAAELALNPWSDAEIVSVAGIAGEVVPLNYGRIFAEPRLDIDRLTKLARQVTDTVESSGRHVLASRVADGEDAMGTHRGDRPRRRSRRRRLEARDRRSTRRDWNAPRPARRWPS